MIVKNADGLHRLRRLRSYLSEGLFHLRRGRKRLPTSANAEPLVPGCSAVRKQGGSARTVPCAGQHGMLGVRAAAGGGPFRPSRRQLMIRPQRPSVHARRRRRRSVCAESVTARGNGFRRGIRRPRRDRSSIYLLRASPRSIRPSCDRRAVAAKFVADHRRRAIAIRANCSCCAAPPRSSFADTALSPLRQRPGIREHVQNNQACRAWHGACASLRNLPQGETP